MPIQLSHIDHVVLTVADVDVTLSFYQRVLGMKAEAYGQGRKALVFGKQKFNVHPLQNDIEPKAAKPTPGSMDLCLISTTPLAKVMEHMKAQHVKIEKGPIKRVGVGGLITSIYIRDPDHNLIEISNYG
jgi:catechol 2,3-dioxygenase-like lactoylglutathione lyase family enzyme